MSEEQQYCPECGAEVHERVRVAVWDYGVYINEYTCRPCDERYAAARRALPRWKRLFTSEQRPAFSRISATGVRMTPRAEQPTDATPPATREATEQRFAATEGRMLREAILRWREEWKAIPVGGDAGTHAIETLSSLWLQIQDGRAAAVGGTPTVSDAEVERDIQEIVSLVISVGAAGRTGVETSHLVNGIEDRLRQFASRRTSTGQVAPLPQTTCSACGKLKSDPSLTIDLRKECRCIPAASAPAAPVTDAPAPAKCPTCYSTDVVRSLGNFCSDAWHSAPAVSAAPTGTDAPTRDDSALRTAQGELRMDAYYYGFDATGVIEVDRILAAVACAGKGFHHTESWTEELGDGRLNHVEQMQLWANYAAEAIKQLRSMNVPAGRRLSVELPKGPDYLNYTPEHFDKAWNTVLRSDDEGMASVNRFALRSLVNTARVVVVAADATRPAPTDAPAAPPARDTIQLDATIELAEKALERHKESGFHESPPCGGCHWWQGFIAALEQIRDGTEATHPAFDTCRAAPPASEPRCPTCGFRVGEGRGTHYYADERRIDLCRDAWHDAPREERP